MRAFQRAHPGIALSDRRTAAARLRREAVHRRDGLFDIFLCHSSSDAVLIGGVKRMLEDTGATVYVDWIDDPQLDRENVSAATASKLRQRIIQSACLIYADTPASRSSVWMPWEVGYADGSDRRVAVLPVVQRSDDEFAGREFVGLYPKVSLVHGVLALRGTSGPLSLRDWRLRR